MSFDKHMGKEHRKPYRGAKAIDKLCRNHSECYICFSNRTISNTRRKQSAEDKLKENTPVQINAEVVI